MSMVHWINPINGTWNTAFDWSADAIPGGSDNVFIDATGPTYSVTSIQSNAAGTLTIVSNATLTIASSVFTIFGNISNAGAIQIAAASNNAELATNGAVSLSGGGTVTLSNSGTSVPGALIAQATGGSPLTNVDNTIEGFGQIGGNSGLALVNQGTVDANVSGQMLALNGSGGVTNSNLLEATNSGTLAISTGVTNTGGNITAKGGTVAISNSATITGGTLNSTASGLLETIGEATLNGVMISSGTTYTIGTGSRTHLVGTINNAGTIQITAGSNNAQLDSNGPASLTGGGTVTLSNSGSNVAFLVQAASGSPLTNVDNTIEGFGQIGGNSGLALVNQGTVDANVSGQTLALNGSGGVTNSNLLEATNGGLLDITSAIGGSGQLEIGAGSEIELGSATSEMTTFTGAANAKLRLDLPAGSYTGTIASFAQGDILELANTNALTATPTLNGANTTITVSLNGGGSLIYTLAGNLTNDTFNIAHVGPDSDITVTVPLAGQIGLTAATEGVALAGTTTLASFTDTNTSDTASTFTASINWGDGTTSTGTVTGSNGAFTVSGGHTYADEGSFPLGVSITDTANNTSLPLSGTVVAAEADVLTPQGVTFAANPGQAFSGTVATFTDGDTSNVAGDFSATINWGDGTTTTGVIADTAGAIAVSGTHTYVATGQDAVTVTLTDDTPGMATTTADSTANVGPQLAGQIGLTAATEGVALAGTTTLASFTDTNTSDTASTFTASINWGDGTTSTGTVTGSNGAFTVSGGHTYADEGSFPLGVSITDTANNTSLPLSGTVVAAEADVLTPQGVTFAANPGQAFSGTVATFTDGDTSNVAGDFSATINWGDGTTTTGVIADTAGAIAVSGTHTYVATGQDAVTVTLTDDTPGMATTTADSTANVGPQLVVKVTLSGTPQEGQTLTAGASSNDDQATIHYQWQSSADGVTFSSIANAAGGATYLVQETDEGREIRVIATAADPGTNAAGSATSSPTLAVTDAPPTLSVSISGTAQEGQTLTAIGVANSGDAVISYRWQVLNGSTWVNIAGATKSTYLVTEANEGHQLRVKATSSDVDGTGTSATSAPTASAIDIAPALSVTVSGAAQQGQILTATANAVSDGDGGKITYQWQELVGLNWVAIAGATHATYTATEAVEGDQIRTLATFTDDTGQTVSATSLPTTPVLDVTPTLSVTVSGTAQEGQKLTAHALVTSDRDGGATTYQWQKLVGTTWTDITGATASTYQVAELDEGYQIRVAAAFTDDAGQIAFATSAATASAIDIKPTLSMTVGGVAQEGQTLMATAIANDFDAIIGYQWQQLIGGNWTNIIGATGSAYPITEANEGSRLRVVATSSDSDGSGTSATSTATASVLDSAPSVTVPNPPSLFVAAGGSALLPLSVSGFDPDDKVTVKIAGLPAFETITDNLDKKTFSGSSVTLTAAEVNSGLTLHSSYGGTGQPVNVLTVTAANTTAGEGATSAAQTITVTDPPAPSTLAGAQDRNGALQDLAVDQRVALLGQYMASTFTPSGAGDAATLPADPMAPTPQQVSLVQPQHL
jgi:hypothetical protein